MTNDLTKDLRELQHMLNRWVGKVSVWQQWGASRLIWYNNKSSVWLRRYWRLNYSIKGINIHMLQIGPVTFVWS